MSRSHRRTIAIVACVLWLLGVEVLPALHLATHEGDHSHERDGSIVRAGEHRHGDTVHSHAKPREPERRRPQLALDDAPSAHVAAGIAHHALALHQPASPLLAPLAVDRPTIPTIHAPRVAPRGIAIARPHARGPPAGALLVTPSTI